jgi:hypothetical protein
MKVKISKRPLRVLDLDCEARPLSWIAQDYVSKEITAIAACFIGYKEPVFCKVLGESTTEEMLEEFVELYNQADIVTGHYIRGYDLPLINSALAEFGYHPLHSKLAHDTKIDLINSSGISKSQESLGAMLGLVAPKVQMDQNKWRTANRLTEEGIAFTKARVVGDVQQHIQLREALLERGMLGPPKIWKSVGYHPTIYTP